MGEVVKTTVRLDGSTYKRLVEVARLNERSANAEFRVAVRDHVNAHPMDSAAAAANKPAGAPAGVGSTAVGLHSLEGAPALGVVAGTPSEPPPTTPWASLSSTVAR